MYLPSNRQCDSPNGRTPIPAAEVAAGQMARAVVNQQVATANQAWAGVLRRDWRSFASLGPQVAWQVMNAPIGSSPPSVFAGSTPPVNVTPGTPSSPSPSAPGNPGDAPIGVDLVSSDPASGNNSTGGRGSGGSRRGNGNSGGNSGGGSSGSRRGNGNAGGGSGGVTTDGADFANTFGPGAVPFQKYIGPLPPDGSPGSLVYGGSPYNRPAAIGAQPPSMPVAQAGYFSASCPSPDGVSMVPLGEPVYPDAVAAGGSDSSGGIGYALLGLVALAGLAYFADRDDKKKGRTKA